jgi:UDP-2,3-diacylglucosamine pyrophosphatase LpxH
MKRKIAFISDLHIGSRYALFPERFLTAEKIEINTKPSDLLKIWGYWLQFCHKCDEIGIDSIVVLGDLLDGQNHRENAANLITANMDEQKEAAVEVLSRIVKGKRKLFVIGGSGYHKGMGNNNNPEKDVCGALNGSWLGAIKNVRFLPSQKLFNLSHGESAAYIYVEMLMGREMLFMKAAEALGKIPKISVIARGHLHRFAHIHAHGVHFLQLPGWKAFEPSKIFLKSYPKMQPDVGGCVLQIDDEDRIKVWPYIYPNPHIADGTIDA